LAKAAAVFGVLILGLGGLAAVGLILVATFSRQSASPLTSAVGGVPGEDWTSPSLGVMKWIPAGTFTMGSPYGVGEDDEHPQHTVRLSRGFWMMEHEVTQGEWEAVMGSNPSNFSTCGPTCPVEQVSWDDAVSFAKKVSTRDGLEYRLPTEAEWEYAARGG
jgi:formylglycine-generating enzyme required for sulfatase activity